VIAAREHTNDLGNKRWLILGEYTWVTFSLAPKAKNHGSLHLTGHSVLPIFPTWRYFMKAVVVHQYGGPEVLKFEEYPDPVPDPGEVLVRVAATSVNPID
jgi:hypothetical protein